MKITLDTNVLVRGNQNSTGPARALLNIIVGGEHSLVLSQSLLYELEEVLHDPRVRGLTRLSDAQIAEYLAFLTEAAELVDIGPPVTFGVPDLDDWVVLRTAIHGDVDVLCSLDEVFWSSDLAMVYERYRFRPMTDVELLALLRGT